MVCGSPFESSNDLSLGQVFPIVNRRDTDWNQWRNREYTWLQVNLEAPDQLRQRVAWALSQLLVIARGAIGVEGSHSEVFLGYYDIFTRHAFGSELLVHPVVLWCIVYPTRLTSTASHDKTQTTVTFFERSVTVP